MTEAINAIYEFLTVFAPYEADEAIKDWETALAEEPEEIMTWIELYDDGETIDEELKDLYDNMYDVCYDYICGLDIDL